MQASHILFIKVMCHFGLKDIGVWIPFSKITKTYLKSAGLEVRKWDPTLFLPLKLQDHITSVLVASISHFKKSLGDGGNERRVLVKIFSCAPWSNILDFMKKMISKISLSIAFCLFKAYTVSEHFEESSAKIVKTQATNQAWTQCGICKDVLKTFRCRLLTWI